MDPRDFLEQLIQERGDDYAGLSRLIGRNPAYIQQFIKRGTPKRLSEDDRKLLATYFGVSEQLLGAPAEGPVIAGRVAVPRLAVRAAAGAGALDAHDRAVSHVTFDGRWLRSLGAADPNGLSIIKVEGDSMAPTLSDGDEILVDCGQGSKRPRDGVFVLRIDEALLVKRLSVNPAQRTVAIKSDNPSYPSFEDCPLADVAIVGRVVLTVRRVA
jgi:phage repressor protein C with HTH and peptisase S24 domain